jgi:diguanylate cyclase (GGDEF)-like protein
LASIGAVFIVIPLPPTPSLAVSPPPILPTPVATPSLGATASPALPLLGSSATVGTTNTDTPASSAPTTDPPAGGSRAPRASGATAATGAPAPGSGSAGTDHRVTIPFTTIVLTSPLDVALIGALAMLPLLLGIWLLLLVRTLAEARRARDAQMRLTLAADLGLRPRELTSLTTDALFKLREKAAFDELTGVLRRAAGISLAEHEIARAHRHRTPLAVAFIDVDGLKETNDRDGHAEGDKLLRGVAQALRDGLRGEDLLVRYGGDEFVCVLPETTARAARAKVRSVQSEADKAGMRFSFGLAELERHDDVVALLARADRELYDFKAKRGEIVQLPPPGSTRRRKQRRASA